VEDSLTLSISRVVARSRAQVEATAASEEAIRPWYGYLESQLRKLVEKLELDDMAGIEIAQPCVETFGPTRIPGVKSKASLCIYPRP